MADFAPGKIVAVSHMPASRFNLETFMRYQRKLVLHTRDPRPAIHSMAIFLRNGWNESKEIESSRCSPIRKALHAIEVADIRHYTGLNDPELDLHEFIEAMIDRFYLDSINWLRDWMQVIQTNKDLEILRLRHDLLKSDQDEYFSRIFDFYGIERPENLVEMTRDGEGHFRKGDNEEWKEVFSAKQISRVNAMLTDDLREFYGWR